MTEDPAAPVTVEAVFERFPASVRGAVVVRGLDSEPHQIRMAAAWVVEAHASGREIRPVAVEPVTVDIAPHRDVMIPFDIPFSGLGPGWYCIAAEIVVDGSIRVRGPEGGGKRFVVPWQDDQVRRGDLRPNLEIRLPGGKPARIERVELKSDGAVVRWRPPEGAEDPELKVSAGSRRLPIVETSDDQRTGTRTNVIHPVPRRATQLTFEVSARGRPKASSTLDLV